MRVGDRETRSIWRDPATGAVCIVDQTKLPHEFVTVDLAGLDDAVHAIRDMQVRGAPLIGVTAAYGLALAMRDDASDEGIANAAGALIATRPTAVNLAWALQRVCAGTRDVSPGERFDAAFEIADALADEDAALCEAIGDHGLGLIQEIARRRIDADSPVRILTHCNAGWLATVDWGTALAPVYKAHAAGIPLHIWVDETRPRNQGAALTAWELGQAGISHAVIVDNAGGHLMQRGMVDLCITGADRVTRAGDVCNKIGTYLKALAALDTGVPFHVAFPASTIDWSIEDGVVEIPIEEREDHEVTHIEGRTDSGEVTRVRITPEDSAAANYAFDVTPAHLVTGFITERGICEASGGGLLSLYPERAS